MTFNSTAQTCTSITYSDNASAVDVTSLADSAHTYVAGMSDPEITCECVGACGADVGDTGALTIAWNDGTTDSVATAVLVSFESSGDLDGAITSSMTFKSYGG